MIRPNQHLVQCGTTSPIQATIPLTATCAATIRETMTMMAQRNAVIMPRISSRSPKRQQIERQQGHQTSASRVGIASSSQLFANRRPRTIPLAKTRFGRYSHRLQPASFAAVNTGDTASNPPANEKPRRTIVGRPSAMARTPPKAAPEVTPSMSGLTSGLRNIPCSAVPEMPVPSPPTPPPVRAAAG